MFGQDEPLRLTSEEARAEFLRAVAQRMASGDLAVADRYVQSCIDRERSVIMALCHDTPPAAVTVAGWDIVPDLAQADADWSAAALALDLLPAPTGDATPQGWREPAVAARWIAPGGETVVLPAGAFAVRGLARLATALADAASGELLAREGDTVIGGAVMTLGFRVAALRAFRERGDAGAGRLILGGEPVGGFAAEPGVYAHGNCAGGARAADPPPSGTPPVRPISAQDRAAAVRRPPLGFGRKIR